MCSSDLDHVGGAGADRETLDVADVIVADGFSGNVALKVMEGTSAALLGAVPLLSESASADNQQMSQSKQ